MSLVRNVMLYLHIDECGFDHSKQVSVQVHHEPAQSSYYEAGKPIEPEFPETYELEHVWMSVEGRTLDLLPLFSNGEQERLLDVVVKAIKVEQEQAVIEHQLRRADFGD